MDRSLAASLLRMLGSLNLYAEDFEPPFLRETDLFYDAEGSRCMASLEVPDYLQHCEVSPALVLAAATPCSGAWVFRPRTGLNERQDATGAWVHSAQCWQGLIGSNLGWCYTTCWVHAPQTSSSQLPCSGCTNMHVIPALTPHVRLCVHTVSSRLCMCCLLGASASPLCAEAASRGARAVPAVPGAQHAQAPHSSGGAAAAAQPCGCSAGQGLCRPHEP